MPDKVHRLIAHETSQHRACWMTSPWCTAPHLSSGGELSAVAGMIFLFKLPGRLVAQRRV